MSLKIHVGCCGFQKSHRVYYEHFDLIEIQQTFYRLPMLITGYRWREEAPASFVFTMKALQYITHEPFSLTYKRLKPQIPKHKWKYYGSFRPTDEVFQAWEDTREFAKALKSPVVVFQCPPRFTPTTENIKNLRTFFEQVPRDGILFAWEPRGEWPAELVRDLCQDLQLIHCVDAFQGVSVFGQPQYYRMHGRPDYNYKFTDGDLFQLRVLCEQTDEVYCLFNNIYMWEDALRFKEIIAIPEDQKASNQ